MGRREGTRMNEGIRKIKETIKRKIRDRRNGRVEEREEKENKTKRE